MAIWILILIATLGYALFQFFSAKAGGKIDGGLVPIIVNVVAVIVPLIVLASKLANKGHLLPTQRSGLIFAALAGFGIAIFAIAFHKIFQYGGNLSYISPVIFGGAIGMSAVMSLIFLKESITFYHAAGIFMIVAGMVLIAVAKAQVAK